MVTETDWLAVAALSVATVALILWVLDRIWFLYRLRRRPLETSFHPQQVNVRVGDPIGWFVTVVNRSPRVLQIRLGAEIRQPFPPQQLTTRTVMGGERARRMSDSRTFQPTDYIELRAYDFDGFRNEIATVRPGTGRITAYVEIAGMKREYAILRAEPFDFEVTPQPSVAQLP